MKFTLVQQIIQSFLIHSGIGNEIGLCHEITRLIVFPQIFVIFSLIFLCFSTRYIIFVRQYYNKRHRIWDRLLCFIRAVLFPPPAGCSISPPEWDKSCIVHAPPIKPAIRLLPFVKIEIIRTCCSDYGSHSGSENAHGWHKRC